MSRSALDLQSILFRAIIDGVADDPRITVEDEICALLVVALRLAEQLRTGQRTPPPAVRPEVGPVSAPPDQVLLDGWAAAFRRASEAQGGPCRCIKPCNCTRIDPTVAGVQALYPLIAAHVDTRGA